MHIIQAKIEHGNKIGRTTGYPTINLDIPVPLHLPHGVYFGTVTLEDDITYNSAIIVGTPHESHESSIQAFILDFDKDIYDMEITIKIKTFIRPLITFDTKDELVEQIKKDISEIKKLI